MLLKTKFALMAGAVIVLGGSLYALADASSAGGSQNIKGGSGISVTLHSPTNTATGQQNSAMNAPAVQNPFIHVAIPASSKDIASTIKSNTTSPPAVAAGVGKVKVGERLLPVGKWNSNHHNGEDYGKGEGKGHGKSHDVNGDGGDD